MLSQRCRACGIENTDTATRCDCGATLTRDAQSGSGPPSPLTPIGLAIAALSSAALAYFLVAFDASIGTGDQRVMNLGRLGLQQNSVVASVGGMVVGVILFVAGQTIDAIRKAAP